MSVINPTLVDIQDEGVSQGRAVAVNFTGAGVTASISGFTATVNIPGGSGSGATGTAVLDFGAFPGTGDTKVVVTGQAGILAGSIVNAWIRPVATADHTADEHILEPIRVIAGLIVPGTGFTIYGINANPLLGEPIEPGRNARGTTVVINGTPESENSNQQQGGRVKRLWGQFTVAWSWA